MAHVAVCTSIYFIAKHSFIFMIRDVVEEDDRSDEEEEGDDNETIHLGNDIIASDPKDLEGGCTWWMTADNTYQDLGSH